MFLLLLMLFCQRGLRTVPNQRYQRPSELRQDLLAMRSVSGTLVSGKDSNPVFQSSSPTFVSKNGQQTMYLRSRLLIKLLKLYHSY